MLWLQLVVGRKEEQKSGTRVAPQVRHIPFSMFRSEKLMESGGRATEESIQNAWKEIIRDESVSTVQFDGQTCTARFEGVLVENYDDNNIATSSSKDTPVKSLEELGRVMEDNAGARAAFKRRAANAAASVVQSEDPVTNPALIRGLVSAESFLVQGDSLQVDSMQHDE